VKFSRDPRSTETFITASFLMESDKNLAPLEPTAIEKNIARTQLWRELGEAISKGESTI